jgi:predicted transcriptional regulator
MNRDRRDPNFLYLPEVEDLLRLIDEWASRANVPRAELADVLGINKSTITRMLSDKHGLRYDQAADLVNYLMRRLYPLPDQTITSIAPHPTQLVKVYAHEKVSAAAHALIEGNFTQVPLYDIEEGPPERYRGLVTDRMILERLLHPNVGDFEGKWVDWLPNMTIKEAEIIEASVTYLPSDSLSSVANALTHFYAIMLGEEMKAPMGIVTRWDFLRLLDK